MKHDELTRTVYGRAGIRKHRMYKRYTASLDQANKTLHSADAKPPNTEPREPID